MGPNQSLKKVSRDHHSFPNPRVRYRVQHIRHKIHGDICQSNRQDAALDKVVVAVRDGLDRQAADAGPGEDGFGDDGSGE